MLDKKTTNSGGDREELSFVVGSTETDSSNHNQDKSEIHEEALELLRVHLPLATRRIEMN